MDQGAHFHRCDLQVHSPRDPGWSGPRATTNEERLEYGRSVISACREKGLDAIAITDHHDMVMVPYVRKAALEETDSEGAPLNKQHQIVVFPDMARLD